MKKLLIRIIGTALLACMFSAHAGINSITNGAASDILPQTWRVQLIGASTPNMALSVAAYLLN